MRKCKHKWDYRGKSHMGRDIWWCKRCGTLREDSPGMDPPWYYYPKERT
ncbi:unnamed protein product [marine sediment metagenome]|uniref:Uncharacterized protein n=1 Tax=marine sediment metagenome TaxID=412755 RepID=X0STV7_9ZZZZ